MISYNFQPFEILNGFLFFPWSPFQLCPEGSKTRFQNEPELFFHLRTFHAVTTLDAPAKIFHAVTTLNSLDEPAATSSIGNESSRLLIHDLTNIYNENNLETLTMTRRKSNNVVRNSGGIGSGVPTEVMSTPPPTTMTTMRSFQRSMENDNDVVEPPANVAGGITPVETKVESSDHRQPTEFDLSNQREHYLKDDGEVKPMSDSNNLVMDLSSRDESPENHQQPQLHPPSVRESGVVIGNMSVGGAQPVDTTAGHNAEDMDMDDAGIYGDMAEGDMVAAMLEEAQIPRSQFLGLNAEEKQKLLEARRTCKFCGKVCIKRSDLQRHLLVHTGERPWLCKVGDNSTYSETYESKF